MQTPILIVGSGSAGCCAGAWLAKLKIPYVIIDKRDGPLQMGQADGVQIRTVEVYESFGISEELLREAHHIREVTFWASDSQNGLHRTGSSYDAIPGTSHLPHVILNQARMHEMLLQKSEEWNGTKVLYSKEFVKVEVDESDSEYPIKSHVRDTQTGEETVISSKYMLGADGAHSQVRRSLGFKMLGDSTDVVWGVMDIYPKTNFPDIRMKSTLRTENGTLLIIPREGGSLVRFYIQLPAGSVAKQVTQDDLIQTAKKIFAPYEMDVAGTFWWSAYSIGQRHADFFDYKNRVFLTGDACHTHSPKAGQGMNTSLQDGYDLGWKLAHIMQGLVDPEKMLPTYSIERGTVAKDLIDFDREFSKMFSSKDSDPEEFNKNFVKALRFTAGLTKQYEESVLVHKRSTDKELASKIDVGMRIPSPKLVKFCDAKTVRLSASMPADGRWRLVILPGDVNSDSSLLSTVNSWGEFLDSAEGPARKFLKEKTDDVDSVIETLAILYVKRKDFEFTNKLHPYFTPINGPYKINDLHKVFADDEGHETGFCNAYEHLGVDPKKGAVVIVRPDHYVSGVYKLDEQSKVADFFDGFMVTRS